MRSAQQLPDGHLQPIARRWSSYRRAVVNSESLTHDMTESESRTPDWTLRTTGKHPLPGREITARRRQSGVRRFLRLWRPTPFGRWTAVICLLTALCAGTVVILSGRSAGLSLATGSETTDDAHVRDTETVSQGQVVATVLNDDYRARLSAAEADLQVAQSSVDILTAQAALQKERIAGAEAIVRATEADLTQARLEHVRQNTLVSAAVSPRRNLETAVAADQRLAAERDQKQTDIAAARQTLEVIERQISQARQTVAMKEAARDLARIELGYTRIVSPVNGQLSARMVFAGEYVTAGTQVGLIVPLPKVWVVANFREVQIANMLPGQTASITVDSVPGMTFGGTVDSFGPVSGALQALLPPDNATGIFTKVAQRFAVKILLSPDQAGLERLRPGMSVIATVMTSADAQRRSSAP